MICLEDVQPVGDVGGVVLTRLKRQIKIGTKERGSKFGHEFFDRVAFGPGINGRSRHHVEERTLPRAGRHDVIDGGERAARVRDGESLLPQHVERLGRGDFVDQVEAHEQLRLPAGQRAHGVRVPHFLKQRLSHLNDSE